MTRDIEQIATMVTVLFNVNIAPFIKYAKHTWAGLDVPADILATARSSFANLKPDELVIAFFETRGFLFRSKGKRGQLISTHGVHWDEGEFSVEGIFLPYWELDPSRIKVNKRLLRTELDIGKVGVDRFPIGPSIPQKMLPELWDPLIEGWASFLRGAARAWHTLSDSTSNHA